MLGRAFRRIAVVVLTGITAVAVTATPASARTPHPHPTPPPVAVRLIGMNDFHGNLVPPTGSSGRVTLDNGTTVDAGGAAYIATHVKALRSQVRNSLLVSSGDNIGASPLASALFHDEPTIDFLNDIGLDASSVGNHEFDEGYRELLRIQFGGCNPTDGCQFDQPYRGARFPYLGDNVSFNGTTAPKGLPALLPFTVKFSGGQPIGIIGSVLQDLPSIVVPDGIKMLQFTDEVAAIDRTSALLTRFGVKAQVVVMHQGDESEGGGPDACNIEAGGPASYIATHASAAVDVFFTGHTHQQYNCVVTDPAGNPRPMIQGLSFGRLLSVVDVQIDPRTHDVIRADTKAHNEVVTKDVTPDPTVQALVDRAVSGAAPIANRKVGSITADIVRAAPASGEEPLGDVIADGQFAATTGNGAQFAITNPGGIRGDLTYASSLAGEGDGVVTYGEAFTVQPFSNIMQTVTITGAQLKAVLEQQWQSPSTVKILQISAALHYTWSQSAPIGSKISNITVGGVAVDPATSYRVSVNNFLAGGGDGFTVFQQTTNVTGGPIDIDAFTAYLTAHPNLAPPAADRITVVP